MASSSTGEQKVFISFRWEDTRYSFVSHLYAALRRENISVFKLNDKEKDNTKAKERAIEGSQVSIVVFSGNYASSQTCLDSLLKVLECRRRYGQLMIPVFYGVSRSDVAERRGEFGEAFTRLAKTCDDSSRLTKWSEALVKATRLREFHESGDNNSDSKLVDKIVADVREKVDHTAFIGIRRRLVEIEDLLLDQTSSIHSLGIWGMSGIGKTTLAEAAFERMRGRCDVPCFIHDFDKKFREKGLYGLREEGFSKFLKAEVDIISSITRPELFVNKLRKKRLLVVLDDVRNPMDAESFLGGFDWFSPGSVIIITSRDKLVLVQCRVNHTYEVKGLSNEEALHLFSRCAFEKDNPDKAFKEVSGKVIKYIGGNPKALSFYGRALQGKKPKEMEVAFNQIMESPPQEILDLFKSSYDALGNTEKNIFLDIACFFNGEKLEHVVQVLEGCGFFPRVGIDVLVEKSLVKISEDRIDMHNLIRDFGRQMIKREEVQRRRGCRLWEPLSIRDLLQYKEPEALWKPAPGTEDIEGILLDTSCLDKSDSRITVKPMAFENMYNLRLLKIYSSKLGNHVGLDLSKGLKSLPHELRLLHWENYPLAYLPQDFDPQFLVELNMSRSQLRKLWGGTKNLTALKTIRLCHSQKLLEIFKLSEARNLELIDLQGCTSLKSFTATGHLEHLQVLNLSGCTGIKTFPEVPPNIRELTLEKTGIREVPESIEKLSKLIKLDLGNCTELMKMARNIWRLESLKRLNLSGCQNLTSIPDISDRVKKLEHLDLSETGIDKVPSPIENLLALTYLGLKNCRNLQGVPEKLMGLPNLKIEWDGNTKASSS